MALKNDRNFFKKGEFILQFNAKLQNNNLIFTMLSIPINFIIKIQQ